MFNIHQNSACRLIGVLKSINLFNTCPFPIISPPRSGTDQIPPLGWDIIPTQVPKLLLLNFLVAELLKDSGIVPMSIEDDLPRQGLHDSFEAAAILAQALKEKQELTHG